jgi:alpha-tubulin suppressor-like RCC1 family protein
MNRVILLCLLLLIACGDATTPGGDRHYIDLAIGGRHSCAIAQGGAAYCWGRGADGELGTASSADEQFPTAVSTTLKFKQITAGVTHTCALAEDDRAYCWGSNIFYQLGDSTGASHNAPNPVAFNLRYKQISAGDYHTCGITLQNDVFCWGYNRFGQAGNGTTQVTIYPLEVRGDFEARVISGGGHHTCAIAVAGGAYCWGSNDVGQLGAGSDRTFVTEPAPVVNGAQFTSIDAGENHTCAVALSGFAFCWGYNEFGQLGDGVPWLPGVAGPSTPVQVLLIGNVLSISAGANHSCAIDASSRLWCWGRGAYGQLAIGGITDMTTPRPVTVQPGVQNLTDYVAFDKIATGGATHACGMGDDAVFCWGTGRNGELGSRVVYTTIPQHVQ